MIEVKEEHNKYVKARCKKYNTIITRLVTRMKVHMRKCSCTLVNHIDIDIEDNVDEDNNCSDSICSHRSRSLSFTNNSS